jgi:hypothetical protein
MAEPVRGLGEFNRDGGIDGRVISFEPVFVVIIQSARHRGSEFGEHHALIFRDVHDPRGFEIFRLAPASAGFLLDPVDPVIVVARPDRVDRRQHHVFVCAPVAGDEVMADRIEIELRLELVWQGDERRDEIDQQRLAGSVIIGNVGTRQLAAIGHDPVIVANMV